MGKYRLPDKSNAFLVNQIKKVFISFTRDHQHLERDTSLIKNDPAALAEFKRQMKACLLPPDEMVEIFCDTDIVLKR